MAKRISAGMMRFSIDVLEPVDAKQQAGTGKPKFRIAWRDMAAVEPISGREFWESQHTTSQVTHRVTMRWRPEKITPRHQIKYDGRTFEISSVLDVGERHRFVQALCMEAA